MDDNHNNYRLYIMVLSVGLFLTFGAGFVVGALTAGPEPKTSQIEELLKNNSPAKLGQDMLQSCYKFMSGELVHLIDAQNKDREKTRLAIAAAIKEASKSCSPKKGK